MNEQELIKNLGTIAHSGAPARLALFSGTVIGWQS